MEQFVLASGTIVAGVFGCAAWFWGSNMVLDAVYPARGHRAGHNMRVAAAIRPWLFLGPAILLLSAYLVYPVLNSAWRSFNDADGTSFVGLKNYRWLLADGKFHESLTNNMLWLVTVPALSTIFGLVAAQVTDRIRWGNLAKSMIFMPMA